jgi:hypothetical protein
MNRRSAAVAASLFVLACAACASTGDDTAEVREQKIYRTGSNIPVKDYGSENIEQRGAEVANPINRPMGGALGKKPGG